MENANVLLLIATVIMTFSNCSTPRKPLGLPLLRKLDFTTDQSIHENGSGSEENGNSETGKNNSASGSLPTIESLKTLTSAESRNLSSFTGKDILSAIMEAYPDKVKDMAFRNRDWAIDVNGAWYYWAQGRLLPEDLRNDWEKYTAYPFYQYTEKLPPIRVYSADEKKELNDRLADREAHPPSRHPGIYNALWGITDRSSSWEKVKTIYFLGLKTDIHRELLEDLAAVEEEILKGMKTDPALKAFVQTLVKIDGYNFRNISGTDALSFHAYGTALDILPASFGGKQVYWLWAKPSYPEWYSLPYEKRFVPPDSFIKTFENHGFVWGGKWFYFDGMHFEYRPEILILNGLMK